MQPTSILVHCGGATSSPITTLLVDRGGCVAASTWDEASSRMGDRAPDVAFLHPYRRLTADIPRMVDEAGVAFHDVPVVVITARGDTAATRVALRCGAFDCIEETDDETRLDEVLRAVLQARTDARASRGEVARPFATRGALGSFANGDAGYWVARMRQQLTTVYGESTLALVAAAEAKEPFAGEHSLTVARYAEEIGRRMELKRSTIGALRVAAMLHDIGKIGVPDSILAKPGPLSTEEYTVIKRHPRTALKILRHVSFLERELPIILHHHEWFNGTGYPDGLAGEQIPIGARVLAVADAIDAMRSRRAYKPAFDLSRVRAEIERGSAEQFDPAVATTAIAWLNESPFDEAPLERPCGGLTTPRRTPRNARERNRSSDHTIVV